MYISNTENCDHKTLFFKLCESADEILIASPFCFPDFKKFADMLAAIGTIKKIIFITTLEREGVVGKIDQLISFRNEMERIGVQWELRLDEKLHGKVYIFKKEGQPFAGIITSANLTESGMEFNHEYGCLIEDVAELIALEKQLLTDSPDQLTNSKLDEIKVRAKKQYPDGIKKEPVAKVDIDDILHPYKVAKGTSIFIKPVGVSNDPIYGGDYSEETEMYFSKKRPASIRVGDILIAYAVGGRRIMGAYKVTSEPLRTQREDDRWPWYVHSECLTPNLSNHKWASTAPFATAIANQYAEANDKPVTNNGGRNLNALNYGCDKIRLSDEYGQYLISKIMELENESTNGNEER